MIPFIIMSAERASSSRSANQKRNETLRKTLTAVGIELTEARGCYQGTREKSFKFAGVHMSIALSLKKLFGQDSILFVDHEGQAFLHYGTHTESIGTWQQVESHAGYDAYTVIDKKVFICS